MSPRPTCLNPAEKEKVQVIKMYKKFPILPIKNQKIQKKSTSDGVEA